MRRALHEEDGAASLLPLLLWVVVLLVAVALEVGAHLVTRAQAANLADAAALAAVADPAAPQQQARRVVSAGGGRLESCRCPPGSATAEVEVSLEVPARFGLPGVASRQHVAATAVLTPGAPPR